MPVSALARLFRRFRPAVPSRKPETFLLTSKWLAREVRIDIYRHGWHSRWRPYRLLCINDGQDLIQMDVPGALAKLASGINDSSTKKTIGSSLSARQIPTLIVGIHANADRMQEYGTAGQVDYQGRGSRAGHYERFVLEELLTFLEKHHQLSTDPAQRAFAGFSLGGLSAFDLVWRNPKVFGHVGVFSGALWWRSQPFRADAPDADRIIHTMVERESKRPALRFWFQAGTADETDDRNGNGIIDAIDDTLQLISLLKLKGYRPADIHYEEVEGGTHDPATWSQVLPDFLQWWVLQKDTTHK